MIEKPTNTEIQKINLIKEKIKQLREDIKRYKKFKYYKKECVLNSLLLIKLLKEDLRECLE